MFSYLLLRVMIAVQSQMLHFSNGEIASCQEMYAAVHADGGDCQSDLGPYSILQGTVVGKVCCFTCYDETHGGEDPVSKECSEVEDKCREVLLMGTSSCDTSCSGLTKGVANKISLCQLCMQREFDNNPFGPPLYKDCSCCTLVVFTRPGTPQPCSHFVKHVHPPRYTAAMLALL